jgi:hypothetical protein
MLWYAGRALLGPVAVPEAWKSFTHTQNFLDFFFNPVLRIWIRDPVPF